MCQSSQKSEEEKQRCNYPVYAAIKICTCAGMIHLLPFWNKQQWVILTGPSLREQWDKRGVEIVTILSLKCKLPFALVSDS